MSLVSNLGDGLIGLATDVSVLSLVKKGDQATSLLGKWNRRGASLLMEQLKENGRTPDRQNKALDVLWM